MLLNILLNVLDDGKADVDWDKHTLLLSGKEGNELLEDGFGMLTLLIGVSGGVKAVVVVAELVVFIEVLDVLLLDGCCWCNIVVVIPELERLLLYGSNKAEVWESLSLINVVDELVFSSIVDIADITGRFWYCSCSCCCCCCCWSGGGDSCCTGNDEDWVIDWFELGLRYELFNDWEDDVDGAYWLVLRLSVELIGVINESLDIECGAKEEEVSVSSDGQGVLKLELSLLFLSLSRKQGKSNKGTGTSSSGALGVALLLLFRKSYIVWLFELATGEVPDSSDSKSYNWLNIHFY